MKRMASQNDAKMISDQDRVTSAKPKEPNMSAKPKDTSTSRGASLKMTSAEASDKADKKSKHRTKSTEDVHPPEETWNTSLDSCDDCERQRRWGRINGHHQMEPLWPGREPGVPPRAQFYKSSSLLRGLPAMAYPPADDMENYFNANADMLQQVEDEPIAACDTGQDTDKTNGDFISVDYDIYDRWIANESTNQLLADEGLGMLVSEEQEFSEPESAPKAYLSEEYLGTAYTRCDSNDSLYNHCEDEMYQTNICNSMEDLGDFIETDMPENPYGCGSSDSNSSHSRTPSDDDLPTLALEPSTHVTGAGDIQGALSLDWNTQFNIEHAQRPPTLLVSGRPSALSSDSSGNKPRTGSDTDYGFYTPTSCASGSSLRTHSVQSPQLSDCSATCGLTSAESSAFASPETEHERLPGHFPCVRPRNSLNQRNAHLVNSSSTEDDPRCATLPERNRIAPVVKPRPHSDGHMYARQRSGELDNLDTASVKLDKDKKIDVKLCNNNTNHCSDSLDRHHCKRTRESGLSSQQQHSHSSLPHMSTKAPTANRIDSLLCCFEHNDLNPTRNMEDRVSQSSDQFNVSRQTSTSDFDQDENSFQEVVDLPLLCPACPTCEVDDDDSDSDDTAFHNGATAAVPQPTVSAVKCNCSTSSVTTATHRRAASLAERRRVQQNLFTRMTESDPGPAEGEALHNLLQGIQVVQISPEETEAKDTMEDLPLPPQTPILNRQWLKKAAKYLDYNFLYKNFFKDYHSESDSDEDDLARGNAISELDLATDVNPDDLSQGSAHIRGRKILYTVLLKDALLKHLQDRSEQYQASDSAGSNQDIKKVMLWTEYQAYVLQVSQIGTSACGATAIINVLKYFDMYMEQDKVCEVIKTNLRAETASIGEYLLSRSVAGTTAAELMAGIHNLTGDAIYGRFFPMYPERDINIRKWLGEWIEKGAVPVVTLNRQRAIPPGWVVPDAWHHQMVYGVGPKGVYLTNPLEIVPEYVIQNQLCSESVLLVRRNDVVSRWRNDCNLGVLLQQSDVRWQELNVLGQVVNVLREDQAPRLGTQCPQLTSHITIPAWYTSGVTLFVRRDTDAHQELLAMCDELPIKTDDQPETASSTGSSMQYLFTEPMSEVTESSRDSDKPDAQS